MDILENFLFQKKRGGFKMSDEDFASPSMRKLTDENPQKVFDKMKYTMTSNWIFDKWYEKIIFSAMFLWAIYSLVGWFLEW